MATGFHKIHNGLNIYPSSNAPTVQGDIAIDSSSGDILYHNGTTADHVQTASNTATLTNKSIDATTNTLSNISNASISSSAAIAYSKLNLTSSIVNSDISSSAAIAYSKLNLASSILNSDISASAAIARSKIATGTASQVLVNDVSGNMSSVASISIAQGGTGQATQQAAINALTGTQSSGKYLRSDGTNATLSNIQAGDVPTLNQNTTGTAANVTGTVAIANGGTGQNTANAAFNALSPNTTKGDFTVYSGAANVRQGVGTDGQVLVADSSQTNGLKWATLNQGAKNYITYNNFENNATTGWSLAHSALSGTTPTSVASAGTAFDSTHGGTAANANLTFTIINSFQLAGSYSGHLSNSNSGGSTAGDLLVSQAYTIDNEDKAKVLTFKFYYQNVSGLSNFSGTSSNNFAIWIYDVTNGAWIQPAGVYGMTQSSGIGYVTGTFQTTSNSTQYQLALININASAGTYDLYVDDFYLGPQTAPIGPAMSDPISWTTTTTGLGTLASQSCSYYRDGRYLVGEYSFISGTNSAVAVGLSLPSGLSIDTSVYSGNYQVGGGGSSATPFTHNVLCATGTSTTNVYLTTTGANFTTGTLGTTWANSTTFSGTFRVPISGWSSNVQMSSDTDTRVVAARYNTPSSGVLFSSTQPLNFSAQVFDTHGAVTTGSSWKFTAPVSGFYRVSASTAANVSNNLNGLYKNGSLYSWMSNTAGSAGTNGAGSITVQLNTGDYIDLRSNQSTQTNSADPNSNWISIERLSGPAVIAAAESVNATYENNAGTSIANNSFTQVVWGTKIFDSHNAMNTSTGTYTVPVSGKYRVSSGTAFVNNNATGYRAINLYQSGSGSSAAIAYAAGSSSFYPTTVVSRTFACLAGDTIQVQAFQNSGGALSLGTPEGLNYISIERVGN